jgi:Ca2+-binding EF-hand superfamily protein
MLQRIEPEITVVENQQIFYMFDINQDGQISPEEFALLINGLDLKSSV